MTIPTQRALKDLFGLSHQDSVSNLVRRAQRNIAEPKQLTKDIDAIKLRLANTENRV